MPTYRKLHTKSVESEDINAMPDDFTRLMWTLLPLGLCQEGRGKDSAAWIRSKIFPIREDSDLLDRIEFALGWYEDRGMIQRYEVGGRRFFCIVNWHRYQGNTSKEATTTYPAPPDKLPTSSRQAPDKLPTSSVLDVDAHADAHADVNADGQELHTPEPPPTTNPITPAMAHYESLYGLFDSAADLDALLTVEAEVGSDRIKAAISWAYNKDPPITNVVAICTAARNWQRNKTKGKRNGNHQSSSGSASPAPLSEQSRAIAAAIEHGRPGCGGSGPAALPALSSATHTGDP